VMPHMRGPELAKRLKALSPELKIVYMSGYLEYNKADGEFLGRLLSSKAFFVQCSCLQGGRSVDLRAARRDALIAGVALPAFL